MRLRIAVVLIGVISVSVALSFVHKRELANRRTIRLTEPLPSMRIDGIPESARIEAHVDVEHAIRYVERLSSVPVEGALYEDIGDFLRSPSRVWATEGKSPNIEIDFEVLCGDCSAVGAGVTEGVFLLRVRTKVPIEDGWKIHSGVEPVGGLRLLH